MKLTKIILHLKPEERTPLFDMSEEKVYEALYHGHYMPPRTNEAEPDYACYHGCGPTAEQIQTKATEQLQQGHKADDGKLRFDLLPPIPLQQLAEVYTEGAKKYADRNWEKGIKWSRIYAAMMRHLTAFWAGNTHDHESKLNHMAHVAWGALTLLEFERTHPELDDRP